MCQPHETPSQVCIAMTAWGRETGEVNDSKVWSLSFAPDAKTSGDVEISNASSRIMIFNVLLLATLELVHEKLPHH